MKKIWNIFLILLSIASLALIALILFVVTAVGRKSKPFDKHKITVVNRSLYVYEFDSLKKQMEYELKIIERDSIKIFKYKSLKDSTRNMTFRFNQLNSKLSWGPEQFKLIEHHSYQANLNFDNYELIEPAIDASNPVLFNKTYGVLGWDNNWGNQFYFVDSITISKANLPIF